MCLYYGPVSSVPFAVQDAVPEIHVAVATDGERVSESFCLSVAFNLVN